LTRNDNDSRAPPAHRHSKLGFALVRIQRCIEQPDGTFSVGCTFVEPLNAVQVRELLG
jgi:hypothetical protein